MFELLIMLNELLNYAQWAAYQVQWTTKSNEHLVKSSELLVKTMIY